MTSQGQERVNMSTYKPKPGMRLMPGMLKAVSLFRDWYILNSRKPVKGFRIRFKMDMLQHSKGISSCNANGFRLTCL